MGVDVKTRSLPLDVFRGLTVAFMILVNTPGSWTHVYAPLMHARWHGLTPTDLVFPFFLLAVGMSMSYSVTRYRSVSGREYFQKAFRRTLIIFLVGVGLAAFPFYNTDWENLRIPGVLQRIALAYLAAAVVVRYLSPRLLPTLSLLILLAYWGILLAFGGTDPYGLETNAVVMLDRAVLGEQHLWNGLGVPFDPEGILSTIPATVNVLAGFLVGRYVQRAPGARLGPGLLAGGAVLIAAGYAWGLILPINKSLWTGSFVVLSTGAGCVLMAVLVYVIDTRNFRGWIQPFLVLGMNPLFIYVLSMLGVVVMGQVTIGDQAALGWIYERVFKPLISPEFGSLLFALAYLFCCWLVGLALYRKGVFIKV